MSKKTLAQPSAQTPPSAAPVDAAIREEALDPRRSFIVQAPAGSGKTELLTRRVLTLLTTVDEPEEVLAITFTRKAASEMRSRVIELLQAAEANHPVNNAYEQEGRRLANAVLKHDQERDWQLLRNPQRLSLRTIDALCTALAHRMPVMSSLGSPTAISNDATALYHEAAAQLLDKHANELDLVLLQMGNRLGQAQRLLAELLPSRDQWLRYINIGLTANELRGALEDMLQERVESRLQALLATAPKALFKRLPDLLQAAARVRNAIAAIDPNMEAAAPVLLQLNTMPGDQFSDIAAWSAIADIILLARSSSSKEMKALTTVNRQKGFPTSPKDAKAIGASVDELKARKDLMVEWLADFSEEQVCIQLLDEVRRLPQGGYRDSDWALLEQLLTQLPKLLQELQAVFAKRGEVDFTEMALRAQVALGDPLHPTDLALAMDLKIKHILVDEFQDTSRTQFQFYQLLVAGWERGDGRTFFAVGDPMQSIYRFRDGDVTLFALAQEQGIGDVDLQPLSLSVNFRAAPAVVEWVNNTFSDVFPDAIDVATGAVPYSPSVAHVQREGAVQLHPLHNTDSVAEAAEVAALTKQALAIDTEHTVAILLRSRAQATDIFKALHSEGIAYQSIDMELLGDRMVVRDIVSLCLALRYPHDRLHWLSVLRSPMCGLALNDLERLMRDSDQQPVTQLIKEPDRTSELSEDAQQRLARFCRVIDPAIERTARGALMPWVEACWLQLGGPTVCRDSIDLDAAERAIYTLQQLEQAGQLWQASVLNNAMNSLYAAAAEEADTRVQVMTLHKSKGLEFDTVILPALNRNPRSDQQKLLNWFETVHEQESSLLLAPISERGSTDSDAQDSINVLVQQSRKRCEEQEKLRLLYVACTRAKKALHLVASIKHDTEKNQIATPKPATLLRPLWPVFEQDSGLQQWLDQTEQDVTPTPEPTLVPSIDDAPLLQRLPLTWQLPNMPVFSWPEMEHEEQDVIPELEFAWAGTTARHVGTVVHQQLQRFAQLNAQQRQDDMGTLEQRLTLQLKNMGVSTSALSVAVEQSRKALDKVLHDQKAQWILDPKHQEAHSEWALTALTDNGIKRIVIDRCFVDEAGTRWIIDFKTGDHKGGDVDTFLDRELLRYSEQLRLYADIMASMDTRPIRAGLYFPLLGGWRELNLNGTDNEKDKNNKKGKENEQQAIQPDLFADELH